MNTEGHRSLCDERGIAEVAAAFSAMDEADRRYAAKLDDADEQIKVLGDVPARIADIEQRYTGSGRLPEPLRDPRDPKDVAAWGEAFLAFRDAHQRDAAYLESIKGKTGLVAGNDLDRLTRWVVGELPFHLQRIADDTMSGVDRKIAGLMHPLAVMADVRPGDTGKIANLSGHAPNPDVRIGAPIGGRPSLIIQPALHASTRQRTSRAAARMQAPHLPIPGRNERQP